jgi:hypothetical protein
MVPVAMPIWSATSSSVSVMRPYCSARNITRHSVRRVSEVEVEVMGAIVPSPRRPRLPS